MLYKINTDYEARRKEHDFCEPDNKKKKNCSRYVIPNEYVVINVDKITLIIVVPSLSFINVLLL